MKLLNITVGGFKNIKSIKLELNKLIALVGLNNFGKSNVFGAIDFGFDFIKANDATRKRMMTSTSSIPLNRALDYENYSFAIEAYFEEKKLYAEYSFSFAWARNREKESDPGAKIVSEFLKIKPVGFKQKYETVLCRNANGTIKYKDTPTGRCEKPISAAAQELVIDKLKAFDELYYLDTVKEIFRINFKIEKDLDANTVFYNLPLAWNNEDPFDFFILGADLPAALAKLKSEYTDKYKLLRNAFLSLFPNIKGFEVETHVFADEQFKKMSKKLNEKAPFTIRDRETKIIIVDDTLNQPIDFNMMSDGAKRILAILTSIVISTIRNDACIAIEEPENSIHPLLLQSFLRIIEELRDNCEIILASHSPYLVQYIDLENIYFGIPNDKSIANFLKITKKSKINKIKKECDKFGMSTGEYCFSMLSDMYNGNDTFSDFWKE